MANVLVEETSLQNIANSIREKTGTTDTYKPSEMATAIENIESGGASVPEMGFVFSNWQTNYESDIYPNKVEFFGYSKIPNHYFRGYMSGSNYSFFNAISEIKFGEGLETIGNYAFYEMYNIDNVEFPTTLNSIGDYAFYQSSFKIVDIKSDIKSIGNCAFGTTGAIYNELTEVRLPYVTSVPTLGTKAFNFVTDKICYIVVPGNLVSSFLSATNWSEYADKIVAENLISVEIKNTKINTYNNNKTMNIGVTYNGGQTSLYHPEQEGYTLSVSGNATLDGNVLTLTDEAQVGDIITIAVTSTYDPSISSSQEIEVVYEEPSISVNLNDGQWIDSGTTVDDNIVYKSDAGSYHTNDGKSTAILTVAGYTSVKLYIRSYAEGNFDYTEAFAIDTTAVRGTGLFTTKGKQSATNYVECIYELDGGTHTIEIMYSKDSGGNSNDDRGYFYIGEVS